MRKVVPPALSLIVLCCSSGAHARKCNKPIIFEGTILEMSPPIGRGMPSGMFPHYRLVKYRVEHVCKGKYDGGEIVIDHSVVRGDELKDRKVGDRVYALVWRGKKEGTVHTYKGIRDTTEGLKYVYRGADVSAATPPGCSFDERTLLLLQ